MAFRWACSFQRAVVGWRYFVIGALMRLYAAHFDDSLLETLISTSLHFDKPVAGREDIIREHKMGCLRISCITVATSQIWIGTSAGLVISTPVHCAKTQPNPPLSGELQRLVQPNVPPLNERRDSYMARFMCSLFAVREMGHSGPCRVLIPISVALNRKAKRMSLNVPSQQASQVKSYFVCPIQGSKLNAYFQLLKLF